MKKKHLRNVLKYDHLTGIFSDRASGKILGNINIDGDVMITFNGTKHKACNLAWLYANGCWPIRPIVHRDGVKCNNWISNLSVPAKRLRRDNRSGIPGVHWDSKDKKWRAQIRIGGKQTNLGNHETFDGAVAARAALDKPDSPACQYVKKMFL